MRNAFVLAGLVAIAGSAAAASGPCPVLAYRPGHEPRNVAGSPRVPKQPAYAPPYVSELEIQRLCNQWLNSFPAVVEFAPALPPAKPQAASRPKDFVPERDGDGQFLGARIPVPPLETPR